MKKILFTVMVALLLAGCSKENDSDDNKKEIPEVSVTVNASDIKVVSATLTGNVNSNAIDEDRLGVTNYGFIVSMDNNPTKENGWVIKGSDIEGSEFSVRAMNLAPVTQYHYVSFFYDGSKYYYGKVLSFRTKDFDTSDLESEAIPGDTYVDLKGFIDYENIGHFDSYRVAFCLNEKFTAYSSNISSIGANYTYEKTLKSISAGTDYNYYFFIKYIDKNNVEHIFKGQNQRFHTSLELTSDAVDIGLSVLWAGTNLGANSPEKYGLFLSWGESIEKDSYSSSNYLYNSIIIGNDVTRPGWSTKNYDIANTDYDVAHKMLSNGWHIPTYDQLKELDDKCKWRYIMYKGVDGFLATGSNGNSIFLPAAGRYDKDKHEGERNYTYLWSGDCNIDRDRRSSGVLNISFYMTNLNVSNVYYAPFYGHNIRPVKDKN